MLLLVLPYNAGHSRSVGGGWFVVKSSGSETTSQTLRTLSVLLPFVRFL